MKGMVLGNGNHANTLLSLFFFFVYHGKGEEKGLPVLFFFSLFYFSSIIPFGLATLFLFWALGLPTKPP